jgi:hypothetical protein
LFIGLVVVLLLLFFRYLISLRLACHHRNRNLVYVVYWDMGSFDAVIEGLGCLDCIGLGVSAVYGELGWLKVTLSVLASKHELLRRRGVIATVDSLPIGDVIVCSAILTHRLYKFSCIQILNADDSGLNMILSLRLAICS